MPHVVTVIPCFDEEERLDPTAFLALAERGATRLLFVDDGSKDRTDAMLRTLAASVPELVSVLTLDTNAGKAEAVRRGLLAALLDGAEVVGYLDADLSTPPEEMERLIAELQATGADAVIGARVGLLGWDIRRSVLRHYLGRIFATAASLRLGIRVYDTQCGAKVFRASPALQAALEQPFRTRWAFDVELLARLSDARIVELPLRHWRDVSGSKLRLRGAAGAFLDLLRIRS